MNFQRCLTFFSILDALHTAMFNRFADYTSMPCAFIHRVHALFSKNRRERERERDTWLGKLTLLQIFAPFYVCRGIQHEVTHASEIRGLSDIDAAGCCVCCKAFEYTNGQTERQTELRGRKKVESKRQIERERERESRKTEYSPLDARCLHSIWTILYQLAQSCRHWLLRHTSHEKYRLREHFTGQKVETYLHTHMRI